MSPARLTLLVLLVTQLAACVGSPDGFARAGLDGRMRGPTTYTAARPASPNLILGVQ